MKAKIYCLTGSVRFYPPGVFHPDDATMMKALDVIDALGNWGVGSASRLFAPQPGSFRVTFEEAGEVNVYHECRDQFGTVVPCGQLGQPSYVQKLVTAGQEEEHKTNESNMFTLQATGPIAGQLPA